MSHVKEDALSSKKLDQLTLFQSNIYSYIHNYNDVLYQNQTHENHDQIRNIYCLHALDHVIK